ncbi:MULTISPECIES: hypothetical protein [unclassified Streptomyces]|uniref:hypothetical protein n=1 Tax=unclassified Streptomyces TaxID=2593676 RepID=UPI0036FA7F87
MIRTQYYAENEVSMPQFTGPSALRVLGHWVSDEVGLYASGILEVIDLVRRAQSEGRFVPQNWDGNTHAATISAQGVEVENYFVKDLQGRFSLNEALALLHDFWDYYVLRYPEKVGDAWHDYVRENGRNPLAGLRDITRW